MGVNKFLCFLLFLFLSASVYSQESNDTIFINNNTYVKHIVEINESISDIANYYNISVDKILETNETSLKLYYKQVLYIPIKIIRKKPLFNLLKSNKKLDVALLLPFYKNLNDTLVASFKKKDAADKVILGKSNMALDFMQGITLALDSLEKLGLNINLVVYDTRNDSLKVVEIIKSKILDTVDIIIGPIYSKNMQLVCDKYGNDKDKIIISPLSKSSDFLKGNPSSVQINTPFKIQSKIITKCIEEKYKHIDIIICYEDKEKGLASYMQRILSKKLKNIKKMEMVFTHIDSIREQFLDSQIIILPSYDRAFVSKMLSSLGGIDSSFVVFGLSNLKNYDHLDIDNLMHLDVHFPDPYYFNKHTVRDSLFLYNFEDKFLSSPNRFSLIAYNIMMHFCNENTLYNLEKYNLNSGKINVYAPLVRYSDYFLERAQY
jgi:hypothetical protein|tara:strand:- start:1158 stop:2456 length:1299 start_codon:yes stop_codon:yes gene_type:complete